MYILYYPQLVVYNFKLINYAIFLINSLPPVLRNTTTTTTKLKTKTFFFSHCFTKVFPIFMTTTIVKKKIKYKKKLIVSKQKIAINIKISFLLSFNMVNKYMGENTLWLKTNYIQFDTNNKQEKNKIGINILFILCIIKKHHTYT